MTRRSVVSPPRSPLSPFPRISGHVLIAAAVAPAMAIADLVQCAVRGATEHISAGELAIAALHLVALYGAPGLVLGISIGFVVAALSRARVFRTTLSGLASWTWWTHVDPPGFASKVATTGVLAGIFAITARAHAVFTATFHRADLAGYLLGALVVAALSAGAAIRVPLTAGLRSIAFRVGRLACNLTLAVGAVLAIAIGAVLGLVRHPELTLAYDPVLLAWPFAAVLVWLVLAGALHRRIARGGAARARIGAAAALACAAIALGVSASTFGASNRVRSVVEQRSVLGRRLVRSLASLTDRDGDRYTWAFGGGDCDDSDPHVHPGALDQRGDGIDQDCFGGDGAPVIVERGRGQFGRGLPHLQRPNFLVVTIDALRGDHLGVHGYERPISPAIDRFAREAVDFPNVIPQSSRSMRSIPAMWTGNYPSEIAYGPQYLFPALLPENVTAPELLVQRGYRTSVIMATDYFERFEDFFQGFQSVVQFEIPDPPRMRAVDQALPELRRLAGGAAPWLLWVHLYNCHVPYLQDGVPSRWGDEERDRYDTEIGLADEQFQRLLAAVDELGLREQTVVLLASDHGEGFGEHGTFGHSTTLYQEEMTSVLMARIPGVAPRRIEGNVGLLDVAPTVLELAGVELTEDISGQSLLPIATGERELDRERPIFAELMPDGLLPYDIKVLRRGQRKLMWWVRDGAYQYYDLAADPEERRDLSDVRRDEALAMLGELRAWVANASRAENRTDAFVDAHRLQRLPRRIAGRLDVAYPGAFTVVGYDLPRTRFERGATIPLTVYYRVDATIDRDLFFRIDFTAPPGFRVPPHFHAWHYPLHSRYPTTRWVPGEIVEDPTPIVIPEELRVPAHFTITLSVQDGDRLLIANSPDGAQNRIPLVEIDVVDRLTDGGAATP